MTDLRLVAVTPDRGHLVLEDDAHQQFRVPIDERLANALRAPHLRDRAGSTHPAGGTPAGTTKPGQLEIALESQLTPREIQSRIRAGRSIAEVATAAGISEDRVERYAAPVQAERAHVADQAQLAPARRASGGSAPRLGDLVAQRLAQTGVTGGSESWDAWRGDDDRWTVVLSYTAGGRDRVAEWSFDPRGRVLAAGNDEARWLVDESAPERAEDGSPAIPVRRLASVPGPLDADGSPEPGQEPVDEVYDREADEARERERQAARSAALGARSGARRPVVPSWDDIMFGTRRPD
jgi:DUF3071 family protein